MKYYYRQIATYVALPVVALPVVLITLAIIRSQATTANIIWFEWASHFLWGFAFLAFGIWTIYIDRDERKEKSITHEPLALEEGSGFLRRIDSIFGFSAAILGVLWVLIIAYNLLKTPGLLNE